MCLGVPARIESIEGSDARVNLAGNFLRASLDLLDNIKVGDYVLLHAGYAIQKIDEEEAQKTLELIELLGLGDIPISNSLT
jgi:hydrogenase expression/formation protein HypC